MKRELSDAGWLRGSGNDGNQANPAPGWIKKALAPHHPI